MNITVGVSGAQRELQLSVELSEEDLFAQVEAACSEGKTLKLEDKKGRKVLIPSSHLGYVIISEDQPRRVGFTVS